MRGGLIAALRQYGQRRLVPVTHEPVENRVNLGTFDFWIAAAGGHSAWVETKFAGPNAKPKMRPGQAGFGARMVFCGQSAVVLVGHPDGSVRLLRPDTMGDDWRECLLSRHDRLDDDVVARIFETVV